MLLEALQPEGARRVCHCPDAEILPFLVGPFDDDLDEELLAGGRACPLGSALVHQGGQLSDRQASVAFQYCRKVSVGVVAIHRSRLTT